MEPVAALALALDTVDELLRTRPLTADDLAGPTPCSSYDVATLTDHVRDTHLLLTAAANAHVPDETRPLSQCHRELADDAVKAWSARGVEGEVDVAGNRLSADFALALHIVETLVHGWDLAMALGSAFQPAPALAQHVWSLVPIVISDRARGDEGEAAYGPAVIVTRSAPLLDQIVGFAGRDPSWTADH